MPDRSSLIPLLLVILIGAPIFYHEMDNQRENSPSESDQLNLNQAVSVDGMSSFHGSQANLGLNDQSTYQLNRPPPSRNLSAKTHSVATEPPFQTAGFSKPLRAAFENSPAQSFENPARGPQLEVQRDWRHSDPSLFRSVGDPSPHPWVPNSGLASYQMRQIEPPLSSQFIQTGNPIVPSSEISRMTADYRAAETFIFPGNEFGPDLSAQPLENLPISDFSDIFRFDLSKDGVQQRWNRVSSNPIDYETKLSGLRVPLVTGTHSWDLHGSLTYYFDQHQQLQRITFRGWTGDPLKLLDLLTSQYQFKAQPTNLSGFYLAKGRRKTTGGLLMKTPPVINSRNILQQYGIVMEINRPDGSFELSDEFQALIAGSHPH